MNVATVIPAYKPRPDHLAAALASIERQTVRPVEVVIVDDGSPEPVVPPPTSVPVRVIRQSNQGISGARNTGIRATTAAAFHVLDQDDTVEPTFYERLMPAFADEKVGVSFARTQFMNDDSSPISYLMPLPGWSPPDDWLLDLVKDTGVGSGAAVIRRAAFDQTGGYRDFRFVQDYRMWIDIARRGWSFLHQPEILAWHRRHPSQTTSDEKRLEREKVRMLLTVPLPLRAEPRRWRTLARLILRD